MGTEKTVQDGHHTQTVCAALVADCVAAVRGLQGCLLSPSAVVLLIPPAGLQNTAGVPDVATHSPSLQWPLQ